MCCVLFVTWISVRVSTHEKNRDSALLFRVQGPVSGLALDWIHHLLYWSSTGSGSVHVGLLDGSAQRALVAGLEKPSAVAVDPVHRWVVDSRGSRLALGKVRVEVRRSPLTLWFLRLLFWAQSGSSPMIERAGLDGRDRKVLVTHLIRHPVALSLGTFASLAVLPAAA